MIVCPYRTYRYHRGCSITVAHLHWPRWNREQRFAESCRCGHHPRVMSSSSLLVAWESRAKIRDWRDAA